eukprot:scaffold324_cov326-Pavlova_lutheri.AAC.27
MRADRPLRERSTSSKRAVDEGSCAPEVGQPGDRSGSLAQKGTKTTCGDEEDTADRVGRRREGWLSAADVYDRDSWNGTDAVRMVFGRLRRRGRAPTLLGGSATVPP